MDRILSVIVLVAITVHVNGTLFSLLLFQSNRTQIAAACCERRSVDCAGSCHLRKVLDQGGQSQGSAVPKTVLAESSFDAILASLDILPSAISLLQLRTVMSSFPADGYTRIVAPPPRIA